MKRIFLIAFDRFGNYQNNSSRMVVRKLTGCTDPTYRLDFRSETFPATIPHYDRGDLAFRMALDCHASAILALGMASSERSLSVETVGRNRNENAVYCPPELNGSIITSEFGDGATIPLDMGCWNLEAFRTASVQDGLPEPEISRDAGGFCCNNLIVQLAAAARRNPATYNLPWAFVHIPCTPEAVPEPSTEFVQAGKISMPVDQIIRNLMILLYSSSLPEPVESVTQMVEA